LISAPLLLNRDCFSGQDEDAGGWLNFQSAYFTVYYKPDVNIKRVLSRLSTRDIPSYRNPPAYTLSAGATKRIKVVADTTGSQGINDGAITATTGSANGTLAQWSIDNDTTGAGGSTAYNAVCWGDGTTACSTGGFNLETKVLPIYGPSIRY